MAYCRIIPPTRRIQVPFYWASVGIARRWDKDWLVSWYKLPFIIAILIFPVIIIIVKPYLFRLKPISKFLQSLGLNSQRRVYWRSMNVKIWFKIIHSLKLPLNTLSAQSKNNPYLAIRILQYRNQFCRTVVDTNNLSSTTLPWNGLDKVGVHGSRCNTTTTNAFSNCVPFNRQRFHTHI